MTGFPQNFRIHNVVQKKELSGIMLNFVLGEREHALIINPDWYHIIMINADIIRKMSNKSTLFCIRYICSI